MDRDAIEALLQINCSSTRLSPSDIKLEMEGAGTLFLSRQPIAVTSSTPTQGPAAMDTSPVNSARCGNVSPQDDHSKNIGQPYRYDASPEAYRGNKYYKASNNFRNLKPRSDPRHGKSESKMKKAPKRSPFKGYGSIYQPIHLGQKISEQGTQTDEYIDCQSAREIEKMNAHISHLNARVCKLESQLNTIHQNTPSSSGDVLNPDVSTDVLKIQHYSNHQSNDYNKIRVRRLSSRNTDKSIAIDTYDEEWKPEEEKTSRQSLQETNPKGIEMVRLGDGFASVPARVLKQINWSSYSAATRKLLAAVFTRDVLATHSLSGKPSPVFPGRPAKKQLPPDLVNDIVQTVVERCGVPESFVRTSITTKCSDESKMAYIRQKNEKNQENVPPELVATFYTHQY